MSFKGLKFSKLANGLIFYDLKGIKSRVIYMYIIILVKTVYLFISQVSGERLQDHWSSGQRSSSQKPPGQSKPNFI